MAETPGDQASSTDLGALLAVTVEDQFRAHPALARANGDHRADGLLSAPGAGAHARRGRELGHLKQRLDGASAGGDIELGLDLDWARSVVDSELFDLELRRRPFRDPNSLLDWDSPLEIGGYLLRDYAPLEVRVGGLCRQLEQAREWTEAAISALEPELAEPLIALALEGVEGQLDFLHDEVAPVAAQLKDHRLRDRLSRAVQLGEDALALIVAELEQRRLGANQEVALGADNLLTMLRAQEGLERTVGELRQEADAELEKLGEQRDQLLTDEFGGRQFSDVRMELEQDHFAAAELIPVTAGLLEELRAFVEANADVPIPEGPSCEVRPTPGVMTAWVSAAYDSAGPLETRVLPCLYYVTTPQARWSDSEAEEWLRYLNRATLKNSSVHEVYPGHHVQHLYTRGLRTDLRRFFWTPGFGEGWAHYAELLMVEAGLGDGDPLLRLAQNQDAMLRGCRYRAAVGIHAEGWTVEDGTRLFMDRIGMDPLPARREASRGTYDPLYLVYTLGKLQILRWREDWLRSQRGDLRQFHRRVLAAGSPPLAALERWLSAN